MTASATEDEISQHTLEAEDVLITKDSESWDDIAVPTHVPNDLPGVLCGYHLAQIRPNTDRASGRFLYWCFQAVGVREQFQVVASGITRFGLGKYWIDNAVFPLPVITTQQAIADFLDRETARIDTLIEKKEQQIALLKEKRQALITQAVTKGLDPDVEMKDSGISWLGEVPAHWEATKFGYLGETHGGMTPSKNNGDYWDGDIPWVSPKDMKRREIDDAIDHVTDLALEETGLTLYPEDVILYVVRGMILAHTFPVAISRTDLAINQDMKALAPREDCDADFICYLLQGLDSVFLSFAEESAHGTKVLRTDLLKGLPLFVPPRVEQDKIVMHLTQRLKSHDLLSQRIVDSIDKLREYRSALISAAVTGKIDVTER